MEGIVKAAKKNVPRKFASRPWEHPELERGTALLQSEDGLNSYLAAYGNAHSAKLRKAISMFPFSEINEPLEICDWGCGQGIASFCFLQALRAKGKRYNVCVVRLIEPSLAALERAAFNIAQFDPFLKIGQINMGLPTKNAQFECLEEINFEQPITIHLFSNVLDIETIDLKRVSRLVSASGQRHFVVCIGPANRNEDRINAFCQYFDPQFVVFSDGFRETQFFRDDSYNHHVFGCFIKLLRFEVENPVLAPYKLYPPKQFSAAYRSDVFSQIACEIGGGMAESTFEVLAPFDFGASVYEDPHPVLAVIHNIIARGLPTKLSPWIESLMAREFGCARETAKLGEIFYELLPENLDEEKVKLVWQIPIAVARIQKVIIEALMTGRLLTADVRRILVRENDVPCAAMAIAELREMYNHLAKASHDYDHLKFPEIELTVINERYPSSGLHLNANVFAEANSTLKDAAYDLVIDISTEEESKPDQDNFSEFRARNDCYFNIRNSKSVYDQRHIYTTHRIRYKPLTNRTAQGEYENIEENVAHIRYFLRLIFRKQDFRPGQLPVISRAIELKNVIGLLPTGAGKSLTYQLAAFLQPGVTVIVDPINSLMKDQYEGLLKNGIDIATFINSTVRDRERREWEMRESRRLFVFLTPERLNIESFRQNLEDMRDGHVYFSYGVIDEAHCVSEWGHDFRFSYLHLGRNLYQHIRPRKTSKEILNHINVMALTATASFDVLADVERELSGDGAFPLDSQEIVRYENTNRLELQYRVIKVPSPCRQPNIWQIYRAKNNWVPKIIREFFAPSLRDLSSASSIERIKRRFIERENIDADSEYAREINEADISISVQDEWYADRESDSAAIVFCPHRKGALGVENSEREAGVASGIVNKLSLEKNAVSTFCGGNTDSVQDRFLKGESKIMVATKAFGMGIDKPDIRFTLNVCHSGSLEGFVQEAGRAGRDRKMALAVILYNDAQIREKDSPNLVPVDYGVHKFFYDGSFVGPEFEKRIIGHFMRRQSVDVIEENWQPRGFMRALEQMETGEKLKVSFSYLHTKPDALELENGLKEAGLPSCLGTSGNFGAKQENYFHNVWKMVYRLCCVGLIEDLTIDYATQRMSVVLCKRESGGYYQHLKSFLLRYYSENRVQREIDRAKAGQAAGEIYKCLEYLIDFVYRSIAVKRERAIADMEQFCKSAVESDADWLETNEDLKDFLYFYFNSRYARPAFIAPNDEPFSLVDDTAGGKEFNPEHIFKYLRVTDDEIVGSGTPNDNVKHLHGAVRLIMRALTDNNPTLDFLNVFCMLYLKQDSGDGLDDNLKKSYLNGYLDYRKRSDDANVFYRHLKAYRDILAMQNLVNQGQSSELDEIGFMAETSYHADWLTSFAQHFNS